MVKRRKLVKPSGSPSPIPVSSVASAASSNGETRLAYVLEEVLQVLSADSELENPVKVKILDAFFKSFAEYGIDPNDLEFTWNEHNLTQLIELGIVKKVKNRMGEDCLTFKYVNFH